MSNLDEQLEQYFRCPKCKETGAHVEKLTLSGTGITRLLDLQPYKYLFVSCKNCGYTEIYSSRILGGKDSKAMDIFDIIFSLD